MICDGRARTAVWLFAVHCREEMIAELSGRWSERRGEETEQIDARLTANVVSTYNSNDKRSNVFHNSTRIKLHAHTRTRPQHMTTFTGGRQEVFVACYTLSVIGVGSPGRSSSGSVPGISSRFILGYTKASGDSTPIMLSLPSRQPIFVSTVRLHVEPTASCC